MILLGDIISYPEMCAEHGAPQRVLPGVHSERLLQRLLPLVRGRALHRPDTVTVLEFSIICMSGDSDYH